MCVDTPSPQAPHLTTLVSKNYNLHILNYSGFLDLCGRMSSRFVADTVRLNSGYDMPVIGYGTWQLPKIIVADRIREALDCGYRHVDSALGFKNQTEVGGAIADYCKEGKLSREELFLSSKIWNTYHSRQRCLEQIEQILIDFDTNYMDLIVIHWPFGWAEDEQGERGLWPRGADGKMRHTDVDFMETWKALEEAHRSGKVRSIGLANFNINQIKRVWNESRIKPAVVQIEINPFFTQLPIRNYCQEKGILVTAFMSTGNPGSTLFRKHEDPNLQFNEILQAIAKGHGKSVVQIILRWCIDAGMAVLIKSAEHKRLRQNLNVFKFRLSKDEINRIESLNIDFRILNPIIGNNDHPHFPWPYFRRN